MGSFPGRPSSALGVVRGRHSPGVRGMGFEEGCRSASWRGYGGGI